MLPYPKSPCTSSAVLDSRHVSSKLVQILPEPSPMNHHIHLNPQQHLVGSCPAVQPNYSLKPGHIKSKPLLHPEQYLTSSILSPNSSKQHLKNSPQNPYKQQTSFCGPINPIDLYLTPVNSKRAVAVPDINQHPSSLLQQPQCPQESSALSTRSGQKHQE